MQSKLGLFCDKIMEAGWLAAAIVTPLFFNWYSNRVFEASKVALLRSITMVTLAAWLIKTLEEGLPGERQNRKLGSVSLRTPLIVPVLFFAGAYLLSTVTSVSPLISFWGSYYRRQGLYVVLCYIAIFFSMLRTLRTRQQLERLITVILITSLPVSLYGIIQHYGVDPLVWIRPLTWMRGDLYRVESTLGNPISIGAYLIMVVPLTVWQLVRSLSLVRTKGKKVRPSVVSFGCYLLLLILQLICLVFTQSRGPMMGLMTGTLFFFLLWAVLRGQRGLALAAIGISIALFTILAILNLPNTPLTLPKRIPYVERLAGIYRDIAHDRSLIWYGAVNMMAADKMRAVIGYGPESMGLIFHPYIHPDWAAMKNYKEVADRCHNETLDVWVTGGLIGLFAYFTLFGSILYYGLKWLGLIANSRQRTFFVVTCLAGGLSGLLIPWLIDGTLRWAGVGVPAGILLALIIYLMTSLFHHSALSPVLSPVEGLSRGGKRGGKNSHNQILLIALLSAIVAHFVEIQFGIAITATRTYFWIYVALLTIIGCYWQPHPEPFGGVYPEHGRSAQGRHVEGEKSMLDAIARTSPADSTRQRRIRRRKGRRREADRPSSGISTTLSGTILSHAILVGLILATIGFDLITHQFELHANGLVIFGLLFVTWLFGGITTPTLRPVSGQASSPSARPFDKLRRGLGAGLRSPISNISTYVLGSLFGFLPFMAIHAAIILPGAGVERTTFVYYVYVFSVIFAVAFALMTNSDVRLRLYRFRTWWLYPVIGLGVLLLILNSNLKAAQADIYYKFALASEEKGEVDKAISVYSQAIQLAPHWSQYYASLGWAYGWKAVTASDADQRADLFEESLRVLERAQQMSPFDPDIVAKLGHVYWNWGSVTPNLGQKAEKLEAALAHYQQAVTLSPLNHGHLLNGDIVQTYLHLGETYAAMDELSQAVEAYQQAKELAPDRYESHKGLALVYLRLSRLDEAIEEAKTARDLAPAEEQPALDDLIAQLEARKSQ